MVKITPVHRKTSVGLISIFEKGNEIETKKIFLWDRKFMKNHDTYKQLLFAKIKTLENI